MQWKHCFMGVVHLIQQLNKKQTLSLSLTATFFNIFPHLISHNVISTHVFFTKHFLRNKAMTLSQQSLT